MLRIPIVAGFLAGLLVLGACVSKVAETPVERLFAAQADYNSTVFQVMADYEGLPRCGGTQDLGGLCSEQKVVNDMRVADANWQIAFAGARQAVSAGGEEFENKLAIANTALTTALSLLNSLRAQGVLK